jgi:Tfp pilus assembly major pilin PilA
VDLTSMPAAHTLNLPRDGVVGMSIGVRPDGLVLRMDYAQQPLELIGAAGSGSGTTGIAMVAILAAIAVPAYQEYVTRSQVAEGLTLAEQAKTAAAEYRAGRGRWPANNAAAGLAAAQSLHGRYTQSVTLEQDGSIHVVYGTAANIGIAGKALDLTPAVGEHGITWSCHSDDIAAKLLPASCRPASP